MATDNGKAAPPRQANFVRGAYSTRPQDFMRFHSIRSKILWVSGLMILCGFAAVIALSTYTAFSVKDLPAKTRAILTSKGHAKKPSCRIRRWLA